MSTQEITPTNNLQTVSFEQKNNASRMRVLRNRNFRLLWMRATLLFVMILVVTTWSAGAIVKSSLKQQNPAPGQMVSVDGHRMHIYCIGEGSPTVILEAGLDDFSVFWSQVQPEIAKVTRICSYDRAGLGWSEPSSSPRTSATMVNELHALLINSNLNAPYILAGHSFGGALMRLYAHEFPNEVAGMVLVDAAPDELFVRVPFWQTAIEGKLKLYRTLAPLSSFGLLTFTPESIPDRGLPAEAVAQYRAIAVSSDYFRTSADESEVFADNLAEVRNANISLGDLPLIVISRGYWDAIPGLSEIENRQAWQAWKEMQSELLALSSNSKQVVAEESEHHVQLQQPDLVIEAILELIK